MIYSFQNSIHFTIIKIANIKTVQFFCKSAIDRVAIDYEQPNAFDFENKTNIIYI